MNRLNNLEKVNLDLQGSLLLDLALERYGIYEN